MAKNYERRYIELKLEGYIDDKSKLSKKYNIDKSTIKTIAQTVQHRENMTLDMYQSFEDEHNARIQKIKALYTEDRAKGFKGIISFYDWYMKYDTLGRCCYCGVHKNDLSTYFDSAKNLQYTNARQRGKSLEIERVVTSTTNEYSQENCRLACYICNNAKSDFISAKNFKPIAKGISEFWKEQGISTQFNKNDAIWELDIKE